MKHLEQYYDTRISELDEKDFLKHVGHTEGGEPISEYQFKQMVAQLEALLAPNAADQLLDLCCGNGIITQILAANVKQAVGVDLSENMVVLARKHHAGPHICYHKQDVFELRSIDGMNENSFSKILMHGGLQHFHPSDFEKLLTVILSVAQTNFTLVFSFVPKDGHQKQFFDTFRRKLSALYYKAMGRDIFGHWWNEKQVSAICQKHGLMCSFHEIDHSLAASKYRFNIKISRGRHAGT